MGGFGEGQCGARIQYVSHAGSPECTHQRPRRPKIHTMIVGFIMEQVPLMTSQCCGQHQARQGGLTGPGRARPVESSNS